jgi:hypothetical protein
MNVVILTSEELDYCELLANNRSKMHLNLGRISNRITDDKVLQYNILGSKGELAVAKYLGVVWDVTTDATDAEFKAKAHCGDVSGYEVRTSKYSSPHLLIKTYDKHNSIFILVKARTYNEFELLGWAYAHECRKKEYWRVYDNGQGCHCMPRNKLHDMKALRLLNEILCL